MVFFGHKFCKEIALWKWTLLFIGGAVLFFFLYIVTRSVSSIDVGTPLNICASLLAAVLLVLAYAFIVGRIEKRKADELALPSAGSWSARGFLFGTAYFAIITAILAIAGMYRVDECDFKAVSLLKCLISFLVVAVGEEILFRGIVFRMIAERWNVAVALIVSSLFFGAMHIGNQDADIWASIAIAIEAGLLLGAAYAFSCNLWFPIGIHWAWNFMEGNIFGFPVSGSITDYRLLIPSISGPGILTGGDFGPEASILAVITGASLSAWFIWRYCHKAQAESR